MYQTAFTSSSVAATRVGMEFLDDGASAVEAMVAAAATIAVSYPHMNSVAGDGFWLIVPAQGEPLGILAGGASGAAVGPHCWASGREERGVAAMLTVPGAVAGWQEALLYQSQVAAVRPLHELLRPAIELAHSPMPTPSSLARNLAQVHHDLKDLPGFSELFLAHGLPNTGDPLTNHDLANLLQHLSDEGLDDFYRGDVGSHLAAQLRELGAFVDGSDLNACHARRVRPLSITVGNNQVFNLPAPTQGLASLLIIGIYERLRHRAKDVSDHVHLLIEATKRAFEIRDLHIGDPDGNIVDYDNLLADASVQALSEKVDIEKASAWVRGGPMADTVWLGALDHEGTLVSYIQSLYWEFGSGVVIPGTGMLWTNRGLCFDPGVGGPNEIGPHRIPRHTLNPAAACFSDGRRIVYGAMGGDGQPQTQGALWWRYAVEGMSPVKAIAAPRWLLGRTWGDDSVNLKMERTLVDAIGSKLINRGHDLEAVDDLDELTGHAGMIVRHAQGGAEAATDPRSDGDARTGRFTS